MNLSLEQIFGIGVTQDIEKITIQKSSLNITPVPANNAESLLVAILVKTVEAFRGELTDVDGTQLTDISGVPITYDQTPLYDLLDVFLWKLDFTKGYKIHRLVVQDNQHYDPN